MILIIDNYDSFTYNLVHLVGRHTADVHIVRNDALTVGDVEAIAPAAIMISPGPGHPADAGICEELIKRMGPSVPILGICLGHQAIGEVYGATVTHAPALMHGKTSTVHHDSRTIFRGTSQGFLATRYHSLVVDRSSIPEVLEISAEADDGVVMGLRHRTLPVEGVQFHPESFLTKEGPTLIANWLRGIA